MGYIHSILAYSGADPEDQSRCCQDLALAGGTLIDLGDCALTLICLEGSLWLTRDGDSEDYIVKCGQRLEVRPGDKAVANALGASRIRLVSGRPAKYSLNCSRAR